MPPWGCQAESINGPARALRYGVWLPLGQVPAPNGVNPWKSGWDWFFPLGFLCSHPQVLCCRWGFLTGGATPALPCFTPLEEESGWEYQPGMLEVEGKAASFSTDPFPFLTFPHLIL